MLTSSHSLRSLSSASIQSSSTDLSRSRPTTPLGFSDFLAFNTTTEDFINWVAKYHHVLNFKEIMDEDLSSYERVEKVALSYLKSKENSMPETDPQRLLDALPCDCKAIYEETLKENGKALATRVLKDIQSSFDTYAKKMGIGSKGPTIFGTFSTSNQEVIHFVVKSIPADEFYCNKLYSRISDSTSCGSGFSVPNSVFLDLKEKKIITLDEKTLKLTQPQLTSLQRCLSDIFKTAGASSKANISTLLISEKVKGANLLDFTQGSSDELYNSLTRIQKEQLFIQMGQLVFTDFFLRNTDRIANASTDGIEMLPLEANVGNLMIVLPSDATNDFPSLYAIDNHIISDVADGNEEHNLLLNNFFIKLETREKEAIDEIANLTVESLQQAFSRDSAFLSETFQDNFIKIKQAIEKANPFLLDLKEPYVKEALSKGILQSLRWLQKNDAISYSDCSEELQTMFSNRFKEFITKKQIGVSL